jgi:hypothetical protein
MSLKANSAIAGSHYSRYLLTDRPILKEMFIELLIIKKPLLVAEECFPERFFFLSPTWKRVPRFADVLFPGWGMKFFPQSAIQKCKGSVRDWENNKDLSITLEICGLGINSPTTLRRSLENSGLGIVFKISARGL